MSPSSQKGIESPRLSKRTALKRDRYIRQDPRWSRTVRGVTAFTRKISRTHNLLNSGRVARHAPCNQAAKTQQPLSVEHKSFTGVEGRLTTYLRHLTATTTYLVFHILCAAGAQQEPHVTRQPNIRVSSGRIQVY